jgi:DNA (cytosine-5)-methyltransferase 1
MTVASLFTGIGGFDLAFERLGHTIVYANDIDKHCKTIYDKHFKTKLDIRSITDVPSSDIPDCDLVCGGFPCQAFSIAGKRRGFEEARGTLFFEVARIARDKRPSYLFLENVKGLLNHDMGRTFEVILRALDELGYDTQWQVVNSKDFGIPQSRERIILISHLRGASRPQVFPFVEGSGVYLEEVTQEVSMSQRIYHPNGIARTLFALGGGQGAKTGLYLVEEGVRMLTPLECERIQGFPDGWTQGLEDGHRWRMLGNAVTVKVIYEIAQRAFGSC